MEQIVATVWKRDYATTQLSGAMKPVKELEDFLAPIRMGSPLRLALRWTFAEAGVMARAMTALQLIEVEFARVVLVVSDSQLWRSRIKRST